MRRPLVAGYRAAGLLTIVSIVGCRPPGEGLDTGDLERASDVVARAAFAQLQRFEGTWEGRVGRSDTLPSPAEVAFFVTAQGTAVVERMIIDDPVEMVSVYHLDRGRLVMAHYCAAGNQPRMLLGRASRGDSLRFIFAGGTSLDAARDLHMHTRQLILPDPDHLQMVWETYVGGVSESADTIFLTRARERR